MCETNPIWRHQRGLGTCRAKQSQSAGDARQGGQGAGCTNKANWPYGRGPRRRQSCKTKPIQWENGNRAGRPTYEEMPVRNKANLSISDCGLAIADWELGTDRQRNACPAAYRLQPVEGKMCETKPICR